MLFRDVLRSWVLWINLVAPSVRTEGCRLKYSRDMWSVHLGACGYLWWCCFDDCIVAWLTMAEHWPTTPRSNWNRYPGRTFKSACQQDIRRHCRQAKQSVIRRCTIDVNWGTVKSKKPLCHLDDEIMSNILHWFILESSTWAEKGGNPHCSFALMKIPPYCCPQSHIENQQKLRQTPRHAHSQGPCSPRMLIVLFWFASLFALKSFCWVVHFEFFTHEAWGKRCEPMLKQETHAICGPFRRETYNAMLVDNLTWYRYYTFASQRTLLDTQPQDQCICAWTRQHVNTSPRTHVLKTGENDTYIRCSENTRESDTCPRPSAKTEGIINSNMYHLSQNCYRINSCSSSEM